MVEGYNKDMRGKMPKVVLNDAYYLALENADKLRIFAALMNKKILGIISVIISTSPHYAKDFLIAKHDLFYVIDKYRSGLLPVSLLRYSEWKLGDMGVRRIWLADHVRFQDRGQALKRMGYKPIEITYEKTLTPGPGSGGQRAGQGSRK